MSIIVQTFVMLLIWNVYLSSSDSHMCDITHCPEIQCKSGEACVVTCTLCQQTHVDCPDNYQCTISCNGAWACDEIHIDAKSSSELNLICNSYNACANIIVYCPPNNAATKKCTITADNNLYGDGNSIYGAVCLEFYAVYGWNDLDITDQSTSTNGNIAYQTMHCTSNYSESCSIPNDGLWACENPGDICNNPPIPTTTSNPTTIIPTTAPPTTAIPTTVIPTTSIPTTAIPTTVISTTSIPTTSIPTTAIPTTVIPTTSNPTTSAPTTSIPTTTNPTTSVTTNTPTTSVPTTNIPASSTNETAAILNPTNRPSSSPSYIPTISPSQKGESNDQLTTDISEDTKQPSKESSADSYYILYVLLGLMIFFMIIGCVSVFIWKRKKSAKQYKIDALNVDSNTVSSKNDIDRNESVLDKSPISTINGSDFVNDTNNKKAMNMDEIQLTPTCYKEGNNGNSDADNDDVEEMYTNVITDDGNIVTKKGETAKGEHHLDINNVMYMEDMEGSADIHDIHDKETINKATDDEIYTNGYV